MKNRILILSFLVSSLLAFSSFAQDKVLSCVNKSGSVEIGICGVVGCPVTVTLGSKTTDYVLSRKKNGDGSLSYTARAGRRPSCKILISRLKLGQRRLLSASCGGKLVNPICKFIVAGSSSSSSSNSEGTSSAGTSSTGTSNSSSSESSSSASTSSSSDDDDSSESKSSKNRN